MEVAIPYSSRVAFGLQKTKPSGKRGLSCHPLFITGCIRTWHNSHPQTSLRKVAIPYSSRVAFGLFIWFSIEKWIEKLPSPIHHGLHSDATARIQYGPFATLPSPIHHGLHSDPNAVLSKNYWFRLPSPIHHGLHSDETKLISAMR